MGKNVLLTGRNPTVLANLASALTEEGFTVKTTNRVEQASQEFNATGFDLIAFGRGIDEQTKRLLKASFSAQNPGICFVDGLAPITPLLVKQIKLALLNTPIAERILAEFSCQQVDPLRVRVVTTKACPLTIDLYRLDAIHTTQQKTLVSEFVAAGSHTFGLIDLPDTTSTVNFLVAEVAHLDLAVMPLP